MSGRDHLPNWLKAIYAEFRNLTVPIPKRGTRTQRFRDLVLPHVVWVRLMTVSWTSWAIIAPAAVLAAIRFGWTTPVVAGFALPGALVIGAALASAGTPKSVRRYLVLAGTVALVLVLLAVGAHALFRSARWVALAMGALLLVGGLVSWHVKAESRYVWLVTVSPLSVALLWRHEIMVQGKDLREAIIVAVLVLAIVFVLARQRVTWAWFWGLTWLGVACVSLWVGWNLNEPGLPFFLGQTVVLAEVAVVAACNLRRRAFTAVYLAVTVCVLLSVGVLANRSDLGLDGRIRAAKAGSARSAADICRVRDEAVELCKSDPFARIHFGSEAVLGEVSTFFLGYTPPLGGIATSVVLGPLPVLFVVLRRRSDRNPPRRVVNISVAGRDATENETVRLRIVQVMRGLRLRVSERQVPSANDEAHGVFQGIFRSPLMRLLGLRLLPPDTVTVTATFEKQNGPVRVSVTENRRDRVIGYFELNPARMEVATTIALRVSIVLFRTAHTTPEWDEWDDDGVGLGAHLEHRRSRAEGRDLKDRLATLTRGLNSSPNNARLVIAAVPELLHDKDEWNAWRRAASALVVHPRHCELHLRAALAARAIANSVGKRRLTTSQIEDLLCHSEMANTFWASRHFRRASRFLVDSRQADFTLVESSISDHIKACLADPQATPVRQALLVNRAAEALLAGFNRRTTRARVLWNTVPISQRAIFTALFVRRTRLRKYRHRGRVLRLLLDIEFVHILLGIGPGALTNSDLHNLGQFAVKASNQASRIARLPEIGWRAHRYLIMFWDVHEQVRDALRVASIAAPFRSEQDVKDLRARSQAAALRECAIPHVRKQIEGGQTTATVAPSPRRRRRQPVPAG